MLGVALKLEDNSSVFRLGGAVDEYSIQRRPRNTETNVSVTLQQLFSCLLPTRLLCISTVSMFKM